MKDWSSFFLTGAHVMPAFVLGIDIDAFAIAVLVYMALVFTALFAGAIDEQSPLHQPQSREDRSREPGDRR
jgi:hypothetical protein